MSSSSSKKSPNEEQTIAIKSPSGFLLNAGAGAGKTFVLIEKIIYEIEKVSSDQDEQKLRLFLSGLVVVTFTNKAADEIKSRLRLRLKQEVDDWPWRKVEEEQNLIYVGTIHGYCLSLIKSGSFSHLPVETKISTERETRLGLSHLIREWLYHNPKKEPQYGDDQIVAAFCDIFLDASKRQEWQRKETNLETAQNLSDLLDLKWSTLYQELKECSFDENSKIDIYLKKVQESFHHHPRSLEELMAFLGFPEKPPRKSKKSPSLNEELFDSLKDYLKYLKKIEEDVRAEWERPEIIKSLMTFFQSCSRYIEDRYLESTDFSFSDLEYYVNNSLEREQATSSISLLIVDEFQDTSPIQFNILKHLIGGDLSKVILIGDAKQAIYGFRGGDVALFHQLQSQISKTISLKMNYRSHHKIIDYNNRLFSFLFEKSSTSKEVVSQELPNIDNRDSGEIIELCPTRLTQEKPTKSHRLNKVEADSIASYLQQFSNDLEGEICVLYHRMAPSVSLIRNLIELNFSFETQIKIDFQEDPMGAIFYQFLEINLNKNEEEHKRQLEKFELFFEALKIEVENLRESLSLAKSEIDHFGLLIAFKNFLSRLGLKVTQMSAALSTIVNLCHSFHEIGHDIWNEIATESGKDSFKLQFGKPPFRLKIMSTHASKGLEFDHVIVAGIYTNQRGKIDSPLLGLSPGSFKWKHHFTQGSFFKTAKYLLEREEIKDKEEAEATRLFYVACTRAIKSLIWVNIESFEPASKSWASYFRSFKQNSQIESSKVEIPLLPNEDSLDQNIVSPFYFDHDFYFKKIPKNQELKVFSDVSVTQLGSFVDCPRKFYFKVLCKLDEEDLERLDLNPKRENLGNGGGKNRGTLIHEVLSATIKNNFVLPREKSSLNLTQKDWKGVDWVLQELKQREKSFRSEEVLKFNFFNHMISGIPDLYTLDKDELEVWDFKTGRPQENKSYWFQLYCYAYALGTQSHYPDEKNLSLVLSYIDYQENQRLEISFSEVKNSLNETWIKMNDFSQVNLDHCPRCSYNNICRLS